MSPILSYSIALISINAMVLEFFVILDNLLDCVAVHTNLCVRRTTYLLHSIPIADLLASRVCKPPLVAILIKINFHLVTVTPILKYKYHFAFSLCALRYQH